ncbi:MAG TPA: DNA recombination protein RmuC [Candidatus Acidoferrales bacterium]|nr:DNA recombination protein RmuC [Candidatus Acidoferrales bacterium]
MSQMPVVIVVVLAVFAAWILGAWLRGGAPGSQNVDSVREDMQRLLTTQAQGIAVQMGQLNQVVTHQLGEVKQELSQAVTNALRISSDTQRDVTAQLRSSTDALTVLTKHLGEVQQSGTELTQAAKSLQAVLGGPKAHGSLGEVALESLLGDALPGGSYELQHRFSTGAVADAVVRAGKKLISIDAKFPLDAYRRMAESEAAVPGEFAQALRAHVDAVSSQLIVPAERTLDIALLFVPSESAYSDTLACADDKGRLEDYCRSKGVLPVSPNTLHAYLSTILVGLKGFEFEENARRMLESVQGLKKDFDDFADVHVKLGRQLQNSRQTYDEADRRLGRVRSTLAETATQGAPVAEAAPPTEAPQPEEAAVLAPASASNNGA